MLMSLALALATPAFAVLDIGDQGPVLDAGGFRMRVTNAGIVGNAFFAQGRSFDPSFEFPAYSGREMLNYAALWVGARNAAGVPHVSGGPLLEWRPTLDPDDRVLEARRDRLGSLWLVDDDGDGKIDEEILNGRDDDGDGYVDEDLGLTADQLLAADYVDDRPEAVRFTSSGETHVPLGLSVHQEAMAWGRAGYDKTAALRYTITNHGTETLTDVYVGLYADLDSKLREDVAGHIDDRVERQSFAASINEGIGLNVITVDGVHPVWCGNGNAPPPAPCIINVQRDGYVLMDGASDARERIAVVGMSHTTDPLARIPPVARFARAPANVSFRNMVFAADRPPGQGGIPTTDAGRYAALAGQLPQAVTDQRKDDFVVLVSCGPFVKLEPGQSIDFDIALVVADSADSMATIGNGALRHHYGVHLDLEPDITGADSSLWSVGMSGLNGHDACISAPKGTTFQWDPHCYNSAKFSSCLDLMGPPVTYTPDSCIWTDTDCDACTGFGGRETTAHWPDPGATPPAPRLRVTPGDRDVLVEWDNEPEVLLKGGQYGTAQSHFLGYRLYRIDDWSHRKALLPPREDWSIRRIFSDDSLDGATPLAAAVDSTVDYERILYEQPLYPPGRYRFRDPTPLDGFDYVYVITSVYDLVLRQPDGNFLHVPLESPLSVEFKDRVTPHAASRETAGAWVVPNPYRGYSEWERPSVSGDVRTRHVDFMGLPKGMATIKVWTVAGDLVATIRHDGSSGDGEAPWDLVSRNGQEVESGIYLFTVESTLGTQRGKFVVIR